MLKVAEINNKWCCFVHMLLVLAVPLYIRLSQVKNFNNDPCLNQFEPRHFHQTSIVCNSRSVSISL